MLGVGLGLTQPRGRAPGGVEATGGTVTEVGGYKIHTFTTSDDFVVTRGGTVEYLIVAGGAGAGYGAGGGGGGGVLTGSASLAADTFPVVVGSGGLGSTSNTMTNGDDSSFNSLTAIGGGFGGAPVGGALQQGGSGGSGGGASVNGGTGGSGTSGQGFAGGPATSTGLGARSGGGGGGASEAGDGGSLAPYLGTGDGGEGLSSTISGAAVVYGSGGGACGFAGAAAGVGGTNAGDGSYDPGSGTTLATSGVDGTGGGGGGGGVTAGFRQGGDGGDGIVIIRYAA